MRSRDTKGAPGALIRVSLGRRRALAWALGFVLLFYLLALWMDRRGIYLKV